MKRKKSQISVEYMIFIGFIFIMIGISSYIAINMSSSSIEDIFKDRMEEIGNDITQNAREMFYLGVYSKVVVTVVFPRGVEKMSTLQIGDSDSQENYLIFEYRTRNGDLAKMYILSEVPLITSTCHADPAFVLSQIPECDTLNCYYCMFDSSEYNEGPKNFKLTHILDTVSGKSMVGIMSVPI